METMLCMKISTFFYLFILIVKSEESSRDAASEQLLEYKRTHRGESTIQRSSGAPVDDVTDSMSVGPKGPLVVHDAVMLEVLASFAREHIPPRQGPNKAAGAHGVFEVTNDITKFTKADVFSKVGKKTRAAVRFTVLGSEHGTADTIRVPHSFSVKLYTNEGCLDLLAVSNPVFFVRDALTMVNYIRSQGRNPATNLRDSNAKWDFFTYFPECMYQTLEFYGERGIPDGYRHMDTHGLNTFKMVNDDGAAVYYRFKWTTDQGVRNLTSSRALELQISDPDYATRDLYNAIADGNFPKFTLWIQVMTFKAAERYRYNPFDPARPWPDEKFPWIEVGKLVLTRNPSNYFADVEQIAFSPGHMVPGIEPSPDKVLQGRLFAYQTAQHYRLGSNYLQLPVNQCLKPYTVTNYLRDGEGLYFDQGGAPPTYPNRFCGPRNEPSAAWSTFHVSGDVARYNSSDGDDTLDLAVSFWNSQSEEQRNDIVSNIVPELQDAAPHVQLKVLEMFHHVAYDLALRTKRALQQSS